MSARRIPLQAWMATALLGTLMAFPAIADSQPVNATTAQGCADSVCLFSATNFGGSTFNAGFPAMSCATAPFPALSASNDIIYHVELYSDTSCQVFDYFLESGKSNPNLPAPARSYKTFICGRDC